MALYEPYQNLFFPGVTIPDWAGLFATLTINSTNSKLFWRTVCPAAGDYDRIRFRMGSVSSAQDMRIGFQSVDTSTGNPTGTWIGATNNAYTTFTPATNTTYDHALTEHATFAAGDAQCMVLEWAGTAGTAAVHRYLQHAISALSIRPEVATGERNGSKYWNGSSWTGLTVQAILCAPYCSDGTVCRNNSIIVPGDSGSYSWLLGSGSPNRRGNRVYLPSGRAAGILMGGRLNDDGVFALYDDSFNLLASVSYDDSEGMNSSYGSNLQRFSSKVTLAEGYYHAEMQPGSGGWNFQKNVWSSSLTGLIPELATCKSYTRTDNGSPTYFDYEFTGIHVVMDAIEMGSGGGTTVIVIED